MARKTQKPKTLPPGVRYVERAGRPAYFEGRVVQQFADGTRKRVSVFGSTLAEIMDKLGRKRVEKRRATAPTRTTVRAFLDEWLESIRPPKSGLVEKPRVRPNTFAIRQNAVEKRLKPTLVDGRAFGDHMLSDVTRSNVRALFSYLERTEPQNARARQVAFETLRCAMNAALDAELIEANPCTRSLRPGHKSAAPHRLKTHEIFQLLDAAKAPASKHASGDSLRYFALFQLVLATGLREGEAFALLKTDYDRIGEPGYLHVDATLTNVGSRYTRTPPKTDESKRRILLDRVTRAALDEHLRRLKAQGDASPWLFPTLEGNANRRDRFLRRQFQPLLKRANLSHLHVTFHALRHAAATAMQSEGLSPILVQMVLGHKVQATLGVYTEKTEEMDLEYARVMGDFFERRGVRRGVRDVANLDAARKKRRNRVA
jgi:integrase